MKQIDWAVPSADEKFRRAQATPKEAGLICSDTGPHRTPPTAPHTDNCSAPVA
ncbi:hypothetical protein [Actinomadura sp. 9N407]|uniref:hypothetical protein n=1 Tax=Actinomadura sp. 9N407 TaxID=3375154 RepID=UPI0037932328